MSNNGENEAEHVEQITRTPSNVSQRPKDPKRVASGKKLAEKNRLTREEHAKYKAAEAAEASTTETAEASTTENSEWLPKLSLTNVISLVGIGLTVFNLFMRSKDKPSLNSVRLDPIQEDRESQCEPTGVPSRVPTRAPSFGM